jgi:hypothetical protein
MSVGLGPHFTLLTSHSKELEESVRRENELSIARRQPQGQVRELPSFLGMVHFT